MTKEECEIETSKAIMEMRSRIAELEKEKCELLRIIQGKDKVVQELKEKISILLSCKNCPENKGGWICEKEYEDKCLTQKITYIKELKEENAELEKQLTKAKEMLKHMQGAEQYKTKWHDLQKDPNDVPNDNRYVWTNVGAGYHDDDGGWDDFGRLQNVTAWCEPKFEE